MTVLVTGATGFLGGALVRRLLGRREHVRILVRDRAKAAPLEAAGAEVVVGDVSDERAVATSVDGVESVFHLAGRLYVSGVPESQYYRVHVEGTRNVLRASRNQPSLRRFVHCSTTGVLGATGDRPAAEDSPIAPTNAYERSKWSGEALVREAAERGFPATIVRPGLVYGPGDLHLLGFFRSIQRGLFRPIGARPVWLHPIYIDDQVDAFLLCREHPAAVGEAFNTAGSAPITVAGLASAIAESLGIDPPSGTIPLAAARAAAAVGDLLPARLRSLAPLTGSRVDFLTHSRVYDVSKAERLLGFTAKTDLRSGLERTAAWYRQEVLLPQRLVPTTSHI